MTGFLLACLRATAFLTRLPVAPGAFRGAQRLGDDVPAFPVAGLAAAAAPAALLLGMGAAGLSPPASAILALALLVAVTGALHEDGLADTADGLFGHQTRERALLIMKDSRIGAYGALALLFSVGVRAALLADLAAVSHGRAALALLAASAFSRGATGWLWSSLPPASEGLAARLGQPAARAGRIAMALGVALLVAFGLPSSGVAGALLAAALGLVALAVFRRFLRRRLGGQTGDTLGAAQQITEIAALLGLALAA